MLKIEKERRFLVELPLKWYGKFKVLTSDKARIFQTYLKEDNEQSSRIRVVCDYRKGVPPVSYIYTKKKYISPGISEEFEKDLTQNEYSTKLNSFVDSSKNRIIKVRYYIKFDNRNFEFDVFEEKLLGLAILEIELKDMSEKVITPPYLKVLREITNDNEYSNINLANIERYRFSDLKNNQEKFARRID